MARAKRNFAGKPLLLATGADWNQGKSSHFKGRNQAGSGQNQGNSLNGYPGNQAF
jgi:hypothetical protein